MKQSIMGQALLKGTLMALTNACIIWLFAYIAGFDRSVWMVVIIIAGAVLAYVTAFLEARAMQNAARGGDVSTSSEGVDTSDSSREEDDEDDFVDPGPDPDAGDFDAGSSSSSSSSDYSSYSSSDYSGGGDSGGGDSGGGDSGGSSD